MYGKSLNAWISLVLGLIKALLVYMFPAFEGLHGNIIFFVIQYSQRKLFNENDRQGEREHTKLQLDFHS